MSTNFPAEAGKYRVVLSIRAFLLGAVVAHIVFAITLTITAGMGGYWIFVLLFSALPVWFVALVAGLGLGILLRRIRNQWIHVAVFFAAGALLCAPFGAYNSNSWLSVPVSVALAAALARLSVWKLVQIEDPVQTPTAGARFLEPGTRRRTLVWKTRRARGHRPCAP